VIDFAPRVCRHQRRKKCGLTKAGTQRFKCLDCGKKFTESTQSLAGMRIGLDKAERIISLLCEGMSVSATARFTDTDPHTILDLLAVVGERCKQFLDRTIVSVPAKEVQCDEIWQFVYCKRRTAEKLEKSGLTGRAGDSYCFTAVERSTKLIMAWHLGRRGIDDTIQFARNLRRAASGRFLISTDGLQTYPAVLPGYFRNSADYGMLIKIFGKSANEGKYSPPPIIGTKKKAIFGNPDPERICTSHTERNNGSIRCFVKRMGRLTYCFSKKWSNHEAALALHICHFNFCRAHKSLRDKEAKQDRTPAMASGLADHVWTVAELLDRVQ
jgi:transposase-like protein/IS1 family transposase